MTVISNKICVGDGGLVMSRTYAMTCLAPRGDGRGMIVPGQLTASGEMVTRPRGASEGKWAR